MIVNNGKLYTIALKQRGHGNACPTLDPATNDRSARGIGGHGHRRNREITGPLQI
ncbi:hypothetical protein WCLP8_4090002 [uncultured Gammaproteobacteria bacterium]